MGLAGACRPVGAGEGGQQAKQGWVWEGGVAQGCGAAPGGVPFPCRCLLQAQTYKRILPKYLVDIAKLRMSPAGQLCLLHYLNHHIQ